MPRPTSTQGLLIGIYSDAQAARATLRSLRRRPHIQAVLLLGSEAALVVTGQPLEEALVNRYRGYLLDNEALLIIAAEEREIPEAYETLRQSRGGRPATFVFHPPASEAGGKEADATPGSAPVPAVQQAAEAVRLAELLESADEKGGTTHAGAAALLSRLKQSQTALLEVRETLALAVRVGQALPLSGEWLLDNAYMLRGHIEDVQRSLTPQFFRQLPPVVDTAPGITAGQPRAAALAISLVSMNDARIDAPVIRDYIQSFQSVTPLCMSELWALPLLLRLHLIEVVRAIASRVERRLREAERADFWASRLLSAARRGPDRLSAIIAVMQAEVAAPSAYLADQLVSHLYDEETALEAARLYLEEAAQIPLAELITAAQRDQAADQVTISNAIGSLRRLSAIDWREVFESLSHVHTALLADPLGVYEQMDFATRDRYRHAVEELAFRSHMGELEIAETVRDMARLGEDDLRRHVGYYLLDRGRPLIERRAGFVPTPAYRLRTMARQSPAFAYIGSIALLTACCVFFVLQAAASENARLLLLLLAALSLLPASELAVQTINTIMIRLLPPERLPRLDFVDKGIPDNCRTLVVVPMLLLRLEAIATEVERLEIRYLGNPDPNLRFGLLSDYSDAPLQHMPEDAERLDAAARAIEALNERYGHGKFFLFHRERTWSESEDRWIGWERKRGKLEHLNAFLVGENKSEADVLLRVGERSDLNGIRYVITLDADTQLPRDTARRLVGTIAHPLNQPRLSLDGHSVERGYTIIQPRVSTVLPSATETWFTRIFTPSAGTDPYTNAISDVYQDLAREGNYHGKGIYDLAVFHRVLGGRFPPAHLLSHDLLEGAHVRAGMATDIELFDQFPRDYPAFARRQHRWVRGDWQIADWLMPRVPSADRSRVPNPLGLLSRWKIFDNLRRTLIPVAGVLIAALAWLWSPTPVLWTLLIIAPLLLSLPLTLARLALDPARTDARSWRAFLLVPLRALVDASLLPHQALLSMNAIMLVMERRFTRRNLLEWETAAESARRARNRQQQFVLRLLWVPAFALVLLAVLAFRSPEAVMVALPLLALWAASPFVVTLLGRDTARGPAPAARSLDKEDRQLLREVARQTWRYFDEFVGPQSHHLPPDNFQDFEGIGIAPRTSPTNIGLWLLSVLAAHDFGYLTADAVISRTGATLETMERLEKYEGNLLNWYDTNTTDALKPRYVSMVDSGNLLGCLWTLNQGYEELLESPLAGPALLRGMADTLALLRAAVNDRGETPAREDADALELLSRLLIEDTAPVGLDSLVSRLRETLSPTARLAERLNAAKDANGTAIGAADGSSEAIRYWAGRLAEQSAAANALSDQYLSWVDLLAASPEQGVFVLGKDAHEWRRHALETAPSLRALAHGDVPGLSPLAAVHSRADALGLSDEMRQWLESLDQAFERSQAAARDLVALAENAAEKTSVLAAGMNLRFLYSKERRAFHIGYNVEDRRTDNSFYDLLASEARLGSFIAIARGEVPTEHWWALGRPYGSAFGRRVLLSWSGTMFEYLMPNLLMRPYDDSLLAEADAVAVACQMAYARERGIPWGISEAAHSALDAGHTYQYFAFGVPGVGIKRGLEDSLVVAPYATALALMIEPAAAVENLRRLAAHGLRGQRGFYESIDYTRQSGPLGDRGVVVQTFMAHHQGMSLLAIDNILAEDPMRRRFHADTRVAATEPLLHERVPFAPPLTEGDAGDAGEPRLPAISRVTPASPTPPRSQIDRPDTTVPRTLLLSNGTYHVMLTNAGGGYSRWNDVEVSRWRADTTRDNFGSFVYLRDLDSGALWSSAFHPTGAVPDSYAVQFTTERAEFRRRDHGIETVMEVTVSPEDNAEIRRVTLHNRTGRTRRIELTSYLEVALAPHAADRAHPAFSKMFVDTEALPAPPGGKTTALLARRRPRSAKDPVLWAAHSVTGGVAEETGPGFETDRAAFLGQRRTAQSPVAFDPGAALGGGIGPVLDPVFSLRRTVVIEPGDRVQVCFLTAAGASRDDVVRLTEKYNDAHAATRAFELAWNRAHLELRHLGITAEDVQRFQQLASVLLYPCDALRAPGRRLAQNELAQSALWKHGISGDLPILIVTIRDMFDAYVVREALMAHTYWRLHGLKADLLILNEEGASYDRPVQDQLGRLAQAHSQYTGIDQPGGVFVRGVADLPREEQTLLLTAARAVLVSARGPIAQQLALAAPVAPDAMTPFGPIASTPVSADPPPPGLPPVERVHFNGFGGFTPDGREYVIDRAAGEAASPQPWSNVVANERFGAVVTDSGGGFCWDGNSQSNRLTPWSNDAVSDIPGDVLYLRDEETGHFWTPTALPAPQPDAAYRTRHGQGYSIFEHESHGIAQELTVFVPVDAEGGEPVRVQILRLRNTSGRPRRLAIFAYAEWVLGTVREETQMHVVTEWEAATDADGSAGGSNGLLFARNAYRADFADRVAFLSAVGAPTVSHTGDRTEFLGRNGALSAPLALTRSGLSNRVGAGLDPCGSLQAQITLEPGEERDVVFLLGETDHREEARALVSRFAAPGAARAVLEATQGWWAGVLETVQVETPDDTVGFLLNRWLLYQDFACRVWGRSAFYQSGGAFGFRDQLQDVLALVYAAPQVSRAQILRSAAHQFEQGDVQHWWHPPGGAGVRTRITDDLLWLPFAVAQYIRVTGDDAILDEVVPFLRAPELKEDEHETFFAPEVSLESASLLEHCRRAVARGLTASPLHGLPLIGTGDWNDGMNRVGVEGKGESVWLAWFLTHVLDDFASLLEYRGVAEEAAKSRADARALAQRIEETAWDGAWYRRAYFDDGAPLGSSESDEARIDSLPQSWAVISGHGDPERAEIALRSVEEHLVRRDMALLLLFTPPFDKTPHDPGYIKGYPPGVRENGGQYTHGSLWVPLAFARRGDGDRAVELLHLMNPINHARTPEEVNRYRVEPYVVAADIYALKGSEGRGGWTWYTGSAGWMYRIWLEDVLGFQLRGGDRLTLEPRIPREWSGFTLRYRYQQTPYVISVENPKQVGSGVSSVEVDGTPVEQGEIALVNDGKEHQVKIVLGKPS